VLVSWNKQPGELVNEDDVIAVVETDKVTLDIRAQKTGKFVAALHPAGSEVNVGAPLYKIDTDTSGAAAPAKNESGSSGTKEEKKESKPESKPEAKEASKSSSKGERIVVPVPIMGESITQGVLAKWLVNVNDHVAADDIVGSIETDKVNVEVRSPQAGTIVEQFAKEGEEVSVGNQLFALEAGGESTSKPVVAKDSTKSVPKETPKEAPKEARKETAPAKASPAPAAQKSSTSDKKATPVPEGSIPGTYVSGNREETRVQMSRMRQRIAQRLKDSQNTAAMLTTFQEIDMGYLIELRNKHKDDFEKKHKVKLGFMSAFVKAATAALQEIPAVNGVIDDATNEIVYRNYIDISVAVASPTGLVVPVLRNTEDLSFADIEKAIAHYGEKAKSGKIQIEDMTGGFLSE
jgi:2-oxoglutarate dehydrogenase E2 component (dihydrolipoamide succinyltransferase)